TLDGLLWLCPAGALSAKSAILVGTGAVLACFVVRAVLRFAWQRFTGVATGVVVGPAAMADVVARRIATHPDARLRLVGYPSEPSDKDRRAALPRLGSIEEISRVARENEVERVVVAEQEEMSEGAAEHLIEECKAAGLALTFLPRHYGLLGPGI